MRKSLLILSVLLLIGFTAAGAVTDTLTLGGNVGNELSVTLDSASVTDLDLTVDYSDTVTSLNYSANVAFTITAESDGTATDFLLEDTGSGTDTLAYTIALGTTDLTSDNNYTYEGTAGSDTLDVVISYDAAEALLDPGTYEDNVTFTIAAQ